MWGNPCFCSLRIALVTFNWKRLRRGWPMGNMMDQGTEFTPTYPPQKRGCEHRRSIFQGWLNPSCHPHMRSVFVPPSGVVPNRWWYLVGRHLSVVCLEWLLTLRNKQQSNQEKSYPSCIAKTTRIQFPVPLNCDQYAWMCLSVVCSLRWDSHLIQSISICYFLLSHVFAGVYLRSICSVVTVCVCVLSSLMDFFAFG